MPLVDTGSEEIIHWLWRASKATLGSLTRAYGPAGEAYTVVDGKNPPDQFEPPLVEVPQPMFDDPPSVKRPDW